jgi:hypothetical protein
VTLPTQRFSFLPDSYAIARLAPGDPLPAWALGTEGLVSITRTVDELSIVCREREVPAACQAERDRVVIRLEGPFTFTEVGVLASFAAPLAEAGVSILALSTYDTDYILLRASDRHAALAALTAAGHTLVK